VIIILLFSRRKVFEFDRQRNVYAFDRQEYVKDLGLSPLSPPVVKRAS
jgi:hypothetical protein